ncbi:MAG: hypothetical protein PF693_14460 [Spirochaetia bacterium]|jgi:hypothetical protein|nr:hypothetical protein [Spirochaetia bacterium]
MKYIDEDCKGCDEYDSLYGCMYHGCQLFRDWELGRAEEEADNDLERRKDNRIEPLFDDMFKSMGMTE